MQESASRRNRVLYANGTTSPEAVVQSIRSIHRHLFGGDCVCEGRSFIRHRLVLFDLALCFDDDI